MDRRLAWLAWTALAFAAAWSALLLWAVGAVDVYAGESVSSDGRVTTSSATLVDVNGRYAYIVAGVPLLATVVVALLAAFRPRLALAVTALAVVGVLGVLNVLALLTVGIFVLPTTGALLLAAVLMLARATFNEARVPA